MRSLLIVGLFALGGVALGYSAAKWLSPPSDLAMKCVVVESSWRCVEV